MRGRAISRGSALSAKASPWARTRPRRDITIRRLAASVTPPTPSPGTKTTGDRIVHVQPNGRMQLIPEGEEVIFGTTLYVPPDGTLNRRVEGELGAYKLDLGSGYMVHGTPHKDSIGQAATRGCIRLDKGAIAYLYRNVTVGTPVYVYIF